MVSSVKRAWRRAKHLSHYWAIWLKQTAAKALLLGLVITFQLWLSFFLYGTFYYAYMPTELQTKPVYLDFSICDKFDGSAACPFPTSNVSLVTDPTQDSLFMRGQKYHVRLDMEMPQSPANENLGVFMVKIDMISKSDEITARSSRPAMLRYRSKLLKMMDVVLLAPLFISGYSEEKQELQLELMSDYVDNAYKPAVKATIAVKARQLEIYSASLKIHTQFTGLRYLMFYWPLSSLVTSVFVNFCFLTIFTAMMWRQCIGSWIEESSSDEQETVYAPPVLSYEERRRLARLSMDQERSALFRSHPPHVTIVDPLDPPSQQVRSAETHSFQPQRSDPTNRSPQHARSVRRRTTRSREGASPVIERVGPEVQSSGISSDNSDNAAKQEKPEVETLQPEENAQLGSSGSTTTTSATSEEHPSGSEQVVRGAGAVQQADEGEESSEEDNAEESCSGADQDRSEVNNPASVETSGLRQRSV